MTLYAIKDDLAQGFIQYMPGKELATLRRGLMNVVNSNDSKNLMCTNPEDFSLYKLGDINDETGELTSDVKFEFRLSDLVKHDAN